MSRREIALFIPSFNAEITNDIHQYMSCNLADRRHLWWISRILKRDGK